MAGFGESDAPTGQIAAEDIARIIAEADGTGNAAHASEPDVDVVATSGDLDRALADRQALIQLCLYALDRARSNGVAQRLEHGLAAVGVTALRPDGQRFDPARHEAGGAVATDDPDLEGVVAETEVTGFADHERLLRAPIVTVYAKRAQ
ncbi:nucleotide exchange factor GrpE [Amycolatopsis jiangsuensis]|uniref:Molecular chaperone GrpE (Heat shock protein) n=1 Tax=Amycolatopsis jiangsuensis TaxID=1181879 RepID=A0A840J1M6_9PSEU|nr:nucleotide exchange factor GrpE [Amycolatopsis jiangsuensis]MBB4687332.1 molecular chaperone GrpE (heat shock protein) [Amycolatopsis jiangsuensis]